MPDAQLLSSPNPVFEQRNEHQKEDLTKELKVLKQQNPTTNDESNAGNETAALTEAANQIANFIIPKSLNSPEDFKSLYEEIEKTFKTTTIKRIHNEAEKNLGSSDIIARTDVYLQTIKLLSKKYFCTSENDKADLESLQKRLDSFLGENDNEDSTRQHLEKKAVEQIDNATAFENNLKRRPIKTFEENEQELTEYCKTISVQYLKTKDLKSFDETQKLLLEIYSAELAQTNAETDLLENLAFDFISSPQTDFERKIIIAALNIMVNKKDGLDELEKEILRKSVAEIDYYEISDDLREKISALYEKEGIVVKNTPSKTSSEYSPSTSEDKEDMDDIDDSDDEEENESLITDDETSQNESQTESNQTAADQAQTAEQNKQTEFVSTSVLENRKMKNFLNRILPQQSGIQIEIISAPSPQSGENAQTDENATNSIAQEASQNSTSSTQMNQQTQGGLEAFSETSTYRRRSSRTVQPLRARLTLGDNLATSGICTEAYFKELKKVGQSVKKSCSKGIGEGFLEDLNKFNQRNKATIKAIEEDGPHSPLYNDKLMISNTIEEIIRKLMRSVIEVYNNPQESERKKQACADNLRKLMGFLRTKEDPEVNEQKNKERNLESAAVEQGIYTMISAAYTIARGKNQEQIKEKLNSDTFKAIKKEAKKYSGEKSYGSKKKDYYLMNDKEQRQTQQEYLLVLSRFIGISLFKFKQNRSISEEDKEKIKNFHKNCLKENMVGSVKYNIYKTAGNLKEVADNLGDITKILKEELFDDIGTKILDVFNDFPNFARKYDNLLSQMKKYYTYQNLGGVTTPEITFDRLSTKQDLFNGESNNQIRII